MNKKLNLMLILIFIFLLFTLNKSYAENSILVMCGAAAKPAMEELAAEFEKLHNIKVILNISGSGVLLSQLKLSKKGDIYFPGSVDFIEKAKRENLIYETTETKIVYLVPVINVQKGNPKNIKGFKDLCRDDVKLIIANPEAVCLGVFAVELFEKNLTKEEQKIIRNKILNYVESCEKTANVISFNAGDAVIGWSVFENWDPQKIENVKLPPEQVVRISYLSAAITKYVQNFELAKKLIDFMASKEGLKFFEKYGYFTTPKQAFDYLGAEKPVGGEEFHVSKEWLELISNK